MGKLRAAVVVVAFLAIQSFMFTIPGFVISVVLLLSLAFYGGLGKGRSK
jgi:hypothetical protein